MSGKWLLANGKPIPSLNMRLFNIRGVRSVGVRWHDGVYKLEMDILSICFTEDEQRRIRAEAVLIANEITGCEVPPEDLILNLCTWEHLKMEVQ